MGKFSDKKMDKAVSVCLFFLFYARKFNLQPFQASCFEVWMKTVSSVATASIRPGGEGSPERAELPEVQRRGGSGFG